MSPEEARPALEFVRALHALQGAFRELPAALRFQIVIAYFAGASTWDADLAKLDGSKLGAARETFEGLSREAFEELTRLFGAE